MLFIMLITLPLLISCPIADPFAELEGINLLSTDERAFTGWAVSYSKTIPSGWDYLEFTEASADAGSTTGLSSGAAIFRLELVNLAKNGDFEEAITADWNPVDVTPLGSTLDMAIIPGAGSYAMTGDVLHYNITGTEDRIDFNLATGISFLDSAGYYILRFQLKATNSGGVTFEQRYREATGDAVIWSIDVPSSYTLYTVPNDFDPKTVDGTLIYNTLQGSFFAIGTTAGSGGTTQEGYIDNLRSGRADLKSTVTVDIPLADPGNIRPELLSGFYKFSIMVKNDPTVTPVTHNRMPSESISLLISGFADGGINEQFSTVLHSDDSGGWSDWTEVSIITNSSVQIYSSETAASLRLEISPTDITGGSNSIDIGSLLVAEPSLYFSSDGTFE